MSLGDRRRTRDPVRTARRETDQNTDTYRGDLYDHRLCRACQRHCSRVWGCQTLCRDWGCGVILNCFESVALFLCHKTTSKYLPSSTHVLSPNSVLLHMSFSQSTILALPAVLSM
eukprot:sb/3476755/